MDHFSSNVVFGKGKGKGRRPPAIVGVSQQPPAFGGGITTPHIKKSDWFCNGCRKHNFARNPVCHLCQCPDGLIVMTVNDTIDAFGRCIVGLSHGPTDHIVLYTAKPNGYIHAPVAVAPSVHVATAPLPLMGGNRTFETRDGDWKCPSCRQHNFAIKQFCHRSTCGRPKPQTPPVARPAVVRPAVVRPAVTRPAVVRPAVTSALMNQYEMLDELEEWETHVVIPIQEKHNDVEKGWLAPLEKPSPASHASPTAVTPQNAPTSVHHYPFGKGGKGDKSGKGGKGEKGGKGGKGGKGSNGDYTRIYREEVLIPEPAIPEPVIPEPVVSKSPVIDIESFVPLVSVAPISNQPSTCWQTKSCATWTKICSDDFDDPQVKPTCAISSDATSNYWDDESYEESWNEAWDTNEFWSDEESEHNHEALRSRKKK
jgi:hypothetical protein